MLSLRNTITIAVRQQCSAATATRVFVASGVSVGAGAGLIAARRDGRMRTRMLLHTPRAAAMASPVQKGKIRAEAESIADAGASATAHIGAATTAAGKDSEQAKWTPQSMRTGVIARKRGMAAIHDHFGQRVPVTVLQLENCQVTGNILRLHPRDQSEYHAVQVGASDRSTRTTTNAMRGHFRKAGVSPKYIVREFPVTPDAHIPVGTMLSAFHFVPGQFVDVVAHSIGKGFQGGMKRWGFKGLRASHGVSVSHRKVGSTGAHQDPGRVWPGKKMPGRMGGQRVTTQNLEVLRIDTALDLVYVKGCVPGADDAHVLVRDAKKKMQQLALANYNKGLDEKVLPRGLSSLPFPAGTKEMAETFPSIITAPGKRVTDPFIPRE